MKYRKNYDPSSVYRMGPSAIATIEEYKKKYQKLLLGTGDNDQILSYYKKFGFSYSHTVKNFFVDNYDHEMFEDGKQLVDMIYLKLEF